MSRIVPGSPDVERIFSTWRRTTLEALAALRQRIDSDLRSRLGPTFGPHIDAALEMSVHFRAVENVRTMIEEMHPKNEAELEALLPEMGRVAGFLAEVGAGYFVPQKPMS